MGAVEGDCNRGGWQGGGRYVYRFESFEKDRSRLHCVPVSCVAVGRSLALSEPQILICKMEIILCICKDLWWELNGLMFIKH